jgi:hypothetical protein
MMYVHCKRQRLSMRMCINFMVYLSGLSVTMAHVYKPVLDLSICPDQLSVEETFGISSWDWWCDGTRKWQYYPDVASVSALDQKDWVMKLPAMSYKYCNVWNDVVLTIHAELWLDAILWTGHSNYPGFTEDVKLSWWHLLTSLHLNLALKRRDKPIGIDDPLILFCS